MYLKKGLLFLVSAAMIFSACNKNSDDNPEQVSASESSVLETSETAEAPEALPTADFKYTVRNDEVKLEAYIGSDTNVVIPEYIEELPVVRYSRDLFRDTAVKEITFPPSVTVISDIEGADELETINVSSGFSKLSPTKLYSCQKLKNINVESGGEFMSIDGVVYSADGKTLVYCPAGRTGEFAVPDHVEVIGDDAFYRSSLTSVTLPEGLVSIGKYAFGYSSLKSILFPATLAEIHEYAFANSAIESAELPEGLKTIGTSAFTGTNISELYIPDSVESCGKIFGYDKENRKISAPRSALYSDGMSALLGYEDVAYRGETELDLLFRKARKFRPGSTKGRIFIDLDGDNFPEMFMLHSYGGAYLMKFDIHKGSWEDILYMYPGIDLNLYHDREKDEYFYLYSEEYEQASIYGINKIYVTPDGLVWSDDLLGRFEYHTKGHWDESGNTHTYITEKRVDFGYFNGKYLIAENDPDFENNIFRNAMNEFEIVNTVNIQKIIDEYGNKGQPYEIVMGEFADSPELSPYKKPVHEKTEETAYITIGEEEIPIDSQITYLSGEEATEENFEKLSHLPRLTTLIISGRYGFQDEVDLTGIDKLSGLGELHVYGTEIKNAAAIGKLKNLKVLHISPNADDLTFLTAMDNLIVIQFGSTMEKPADFYKPIYGMKNLRYLLVDWWERNITDEQEEHIAGNAPHINVMYYKWG